MTTIHVLLSTCVHRAISTCTLVMSEDSYTQQEVLEKQEATIRIVLPFKNQK